MKKKELIDSETDSTPNGTRTSYNYRQLRNYEWKWR